MIMASELSMNGRKKIETIQKEFTQKFPYLTLVFLDQKRTAIDVSKSLSEVRQAKGADISIIASLKVNTLEKRFNESFGLIVEVAYQKEGKVIYTKENVDKTLNELNKWCAAQACEPFEFKKAFTGNTISSVQEQLFAAIKKVFADAEAKKINKDNFLDIYIPSVSPARGTHLFFNTSKNDIKIGYYTRDEKFINLVTDANFVEIEAASNGLRIKGNPTYTSVPSAIPAALNFLGGILNDKSFILDDGIKIEYDTESLDDFKKQNIDANANFIEADSPDLQFSSNIDETIKTFVENFGNDDLSGFLENYLESDKIVILSISLSDLKAATKNNVDYSNDVQVVGDVELNDWKGLSKLIGKKEAEWAQKEFTEEHSSGIVLLYCEGKYVYAFSRPGSDESGVEQEDENESVSIDFDAIMAHYDDPYESFNINAEEDINLVCSKIETGKVLTNLLYVNEALAENGFEIDQHQAYFFDSGVLVSDRQLEGFLLVNMDGFYSNCVNGYELTLLISWGAVVDLRYSESDGDSSIDIVTEQGVLTIQKILSLSLKVLYTFYKSVWKEINVKFKDQPFINWNEVWEMGITEIGFNFPEEYKDFKLGEIVEDDESEEAETEESSSAKKAVPNILPKNAVELVKCVSILSFYYLSMNNNKEIYDSFQSGLKKLFSEENFGNSDSEIVQEIKTHIANNTIDQLIEEGELLGNETYDKKYSTHDDFVGDISRYIRHLDLVDDEKFQLAYLKNFVEIGNILNSTTDNETEIKVQDRYLVVQIALSNWYNINDFKPQIEQLLKNVKYNLPAGNLFKYSFISDSLSLMEKAALFTYNIILLHEDGLEIKNKDIIRAKQVIAEVFGFDIKFEGMELKGSLNNSGKDDLGSLIGGFGDNFCFDVMHFYNCHYSLDDFRDNCKDLFVESYNQINDIWGGYIEDRLEEIEFDAEDDREEKIVDQYNEARDEAEDED